MVSPKANMISKGRHLNGACLLVPTKLRASCVFFLWPRSPAYHSGNRCARSCEGMEKDDRATIEHNWEMNSTWNWDSLYTHKIRSHGVLLFKCKETSQFFSRVARIHSCCDFDDVSLFFLPNQNLMKMHASLSAAPNQNW